MPSTTTATPVAPQANGKKAHAKKASEVLKEFNSSDTGLSASEAAKRLREYGANELKEVPKRSMFAMFLAQFSSFMILMLIAATIIAALLSEWIDASAIAAILVLNAILGTAQEYRAEKAIEALRKMVAPTTRVVRGGREQKISASEVVPGDVVVLEAGDRVPADLRLMESVSLESNEASLTGESTPVKKEAQKILDVAAPVTERSNMCFMGTTITNGRGKGVIVATGMNTEFGEIAQSVQEITAEETPLKQSLEAFGKQMAVAVVIGCVIIFSLGALRGIPVFEMFLTSVSLAVAAIPEGLPAVMTIALALGVQRMSKRNAIIHRLFAVEALGGADVILTDKTGTLTKNEMTARQIYSLRKHCEVTGVGYEQTGEFIQNNKAVDPLKEPELKALLEISALCNNASIVYDEAIKTWNAVGDPTEVALLSLAHKAGLHRSELKKSMQFVAEFPFDPTRKRMTVVYKKGGETRAMTKGALETVLPLCTRVFANGRERVLSPKDRAKILEANQGMAGSALRVIAFAQRRFGAREKEFSVERAVRNLTFVGLVGLIDAPRDEVPRAIELCRQAGIEVVMITGDNELTAKAVAREIGLLRKGDLVVNGAELSEMSDEELTGKVERIRVYARVAPEHKFRIVEAWKKKGKIVAVTGDGVNDAPALKRGDIGVSMGVTGTDVAKEVSDVVLADDNFASIVNAVEEGRGIYENIRKCILFIVPSNIAEVAIVFLAILLGFPLPLAATQILWINLVTETIPALPLSIDPIDPEVMKRPPRPRNERMLRGARAFLFDYPLVLVVFALLLFAFALKDGSVEKAQTMVLTLIVAAQAFRALSCRSLSKPVAGKAFENKWLLSAIALMFTLQLVILYVPFFNAVFHVTPLIASELGIILLMGFACFLYLEAYKAFSSAREANKSKQV